MDGLRTPITDLYGERASVPIISARVGESVRLARQALADGALLVVELPEQAQAVEISAENTGSAAASITFIAASDGTDGTGTDSSDKAFVAAQGIVRRIPAGAQVVEFRGVAGGDRLLIVAAGATTVTVHAHRSPA